MLLITQCVCIPIHSSDQFTPVAYCITIQYVCCIMHNEQIELWLKGHKTLAFVKPFSHISSYFRRSAQTSLTIPSQFVLCCPEHALEPIANGPQIRLQGLSHTYREETLKAGDSQSIGIRTDSRHTTHRCVKWTWLAFKVKLAIFVRQQSATWSGPCGLPSGSTARCVFAACTLRCRDGQ
jgi:hypothetical protein